MLAAGAGRGFIPEDNGGEFRSTDFRSTLDQLPRNVADGGTGMHECALGATRVQPHAGETNHHEPARAPGQTGNSTRLGTKGRILDRAQIAIDTNPHGVEQGPAIEMPV